MTGHADPGLPHRQPAAGQEDRALGGGEARGHRLLVARAAARMFAKRLEQLRGRADARDEQGPVLSWTERLTEFAARPLPDDPVGTGAA